MDERLLDADLQRFTDRRPMPIAVRRGLLEHHEPIAVADLEETKERAQRLFVVFSFDEAKIDGAP